MDGRLTRGIALVVVGSALVWFGKGITEVDSDARGLGSAMIFALIAGAYVFLLAFCSLYDFVTKPPDYSSN
jgi:hypothetical protein